MNHTQYTDSHHTHPVDDSEADKNLIHAKIATAELAISAIDEEIGELMRGVRQLQVKKWEYYEKIKYYKGLTTLARRLPYEILAYIFDICVQDGYTRTPLTVSHVCSSWRKAASLPSVWSDIYIDLDGRNSLARTKFCLQMAQNNPLRITLDIPQSESNLWEIMDLLLGKKSQWRSLTIKSVLLSSVNSVLTTCVGPFPEFRALYITVRGEFDIRENDDQVEVNEPRDLVAIRSSFLEAPNFSTTEITRNILPTANILPQAITHLSLILPCHNFRLPLLEAYRMVIPSGRLRRIEAEADIDTRHFVTLRHLHSLNLTGPPSLNTLLPHILAPCLTSLHLRSPADLFGFPNERTGQFLLQFLGQGLLPIKILELRDSDIPASYFIRCFSRLPNLKTLHLHESEIPDQVVKEVFGPDGLLPSLSVLDLRWCGQVTGSTLVELVRSRLSLQGSVHLDFDCVPIIKVTVIHCSFVKKQDIADLASLTVCQVAVVSSDDYCRTIGCCANDRYRKRLEIERIGRAGRLIYQ